MTENANKSLKKILYIDIYNLYDINFLYDMA